MKRSEKAGRDANSFSENVTKLVNEGMTIAVAREKVLSQVRGNFDAFLADRKPGQPWLHWFGTGVTFVARVPGGKAGRVVDDFVNLMDLAPTYMEVGGVKPPPGVDGRSFLDVLKSEKSGQLDAARTWVVTGRERHAGSAREGNLPYPMRALRTKDFLYIRNFAPGRWPMSAPCSVSETSAPSAAELETNTRIAFPDFDASPTKA